MWKNAPGRDMILGLSSVGHSARIPQNVFLTLIHTEDGQRSSNLAYFSRPRCVKNAHVFRVLIQLVVVKDLMFYHHPQEELLADGKVPWRDFAWQFGKPDGERKDEDPPLRRLCTPPSEPRGHHREDNDKDREPRNPRARGLLHRVSSWMEGRGRSKCRVDGAFQDSG
jgi:hypothetical protein